MSADTNRDKLAHQTKQLFQRAFNQSWRK